MPASTLLTVARRGAHLTQRELAARVRAAQPSIARLERGRVSPRADLLERLIAGCGCTLAILPTVSRPVADHAVEVADRLAAGDDRNAYRAVIQLADDLAAEHGAERVALTVTPPCPTGDVRFDALVAGVTEHRLAEERLPLPRWLRHTMAKLDPVWFVDRYSQGDPGVIAATPEPLLRRGVVLDDAELRSV